MLRCEWEWPKNSSEGIVCFLTSARCETLSLQCMITFITIAMQRQNSLPLFLFVVCFEVHFDSQQILFSFNPWQQRLMSKHFHLLYEKGYSIMQHNADISTLQYYWVLPPFFAKLIKIANFFSDSALFISCIVKSLFLQYIRTLDTQNNSNFYEWHMILFAGG